MNTLDKIRSIKEKSLSIKKQDKVMGKLEQTNEQFLSMIASLKDIGASLQKATQTNELAGAISSLEDQISKLKVELPENKKADTLLNNLLEEVKKKKDIDYKKLSDIFVSAVEEIGKITVPSDEVFTSMSVVRNKRKKPIEITETYSGFDLIYSVSYDSDDKVKEITVKRDEH